MRRALAALALAGVALTTGCTAERPDSIAPSAPTLPPSPTASAQPGAPGQPKLTDRQTIVEDLVVPWAVGFLPDGSALVTERDSRRIVRVGTDHKVTRVTVISESDAGGEGGLLGLAVSPKYAEDKTVFLYYTTPKDNRIARWKIGERPQPIVTGIPISGIHNGGRLGFGPDGYLYAGTGDASVRGNSQDLKSLGGKILRMTMDGKPAPGNPFGDSLVWTYGHRNVQGFAWDSGGHMWASEFGQNTWDEINRIEPGKNYGWPVVEGAAKDDRYVDPVVAWHPPEASCSGIAIVRDVLVDACLRGQRLWLVPIDGAQGTVRGEPVATLQDAGRLRAAVAAPDGSVWVINNGRDGRGEPKTGDDRIIRVNIG